MNPIAIAQAQRVRLLYRKALRTARQHNFRDVEEFCDEADWIRAEFRRYKDEKDPFLIEAVIKSTEAKIKAMMHPDPYVEPRAYRGFEYQRNTPVRAAWVNPGAFIPNQL